MRITNTIAALGLSTALALPAAAAPVIDGIIDVPGEGWTEVTDLQNSGFGLIENFYFTSDATNLYFGARTNDDDVDLKGNGFDDNLDLNIGLDGNAAAHRYRILSQNGPFTDGGVNSTAFVTVWEGFFDGGDDSILGNPSVGTPDGVTKLDATQIGYGVGLNTAGGTSAREHEIAIPWASILDGENGWDFGATLSLRVGGTASTDGSQFGLSYPEPGS